MDENRGGEAMERHFDTWEETLIAVKDGLSLDDVPDKLKTPELCLAAVQQDGRALGYVPDALKIEILKTLKPLAAQETN
jgi:hypothetical protein